MSNTLHDEAADWQDDEESTAAHPAGDMALSNKTKAGARTRALAGLTLAVGTITMAAATMTWPTTISHHGQL